MDEFDLRDEAPGEAPAIAALLAAAFQDGPEAGQSEQRIVEALRAAGALRLALTAREAGGALCGYIAFSPVIMGGEGANRKSPPNPGQPFGTPGWFGLGPLAVAPDFQGRGVGSALLRAGLARLQAQGARGVVLLGAPAYYGRFGFRAGLGPTLPGFRPEHFLASRLAPGPLPRGAVTYHPAFGL